MLVSYNLNILFDTETGDTSYTSKHNPESVSLVVARNTVSILEEVKLHLIGFIKAQSSISRPDQLKGNKLNV